MISYTKINLIIHKLSYSGISPRFCKVPQSSFDKAEMIQEKLEFSIVFQIVP